jgi:uncharacterized protein YuzE
MIEYAYDATARAAYLALAESAAKRTVEVGNGVFVDFAADGGVVGIELLNVDPVDLALGDLGTGPT